MNSYNNDHIGTFHRNYNTTYKTNVWCNSKAYPLHGDTDISYYVVKPRNIKWLCHFTPRANLNDIMVHGLKTRDLIPFEAQVTDTNRFDRNSNAICLSISKPNYWMLQRKLDIGFDLCLLLIDPAVLSNKECAFFPHNAATACYRNLSFEEMAGVYRFEAMFEPTVSVTKADGSINTFTRQNNFLDCETTSEQAEIQCRENIEPEYIRFIIEGNFPIDALDLQKLTHAYENNLTTIEFVKNNKGTIFPSVENIVLPTEKTVVETEKATISVHKTNSEFPDQIPIQKELFGNVSRALGILEETRASLNEAPLEDVSRSNIPNIPLATNSAIKQNYKTKGSQSQSEYDGCLPFIILAIIIAMFAL